MRGFQGPTTGEAASALDEMMRIVRHPAFRLGFLDAQRGLPLDHDRIIDRIYAETPHGALKRLGWGGFLDCNSKADLAQYRYEEGRIAVVEYGLSCKAWGHPDYPPRAVLAFVRALSDQYAMHGDSHRLDTNAGSAL